MTKRVVSLTVAFMLLATSAYALQMREFTKVTSPGDPVFNNDLFDPFVVNGLTPTLSGTQVQVAPGIAYNVKKWMLPSAATFSGTNTGTAHNENICLGITGDLNIKNAACPTGYLDLADVAVGTTGNVTSVTDQSAITPNVKVKMSWGGGAAITNILTGTCSVTAPTALGIHATGVATCTATGALTSDNLVFVSWRDLEDGLAVEGWNVTAASTITVGFRCASAAACPATAAKTWGWMIVR